MSDSDPILLYRRAPDDLAAILVDIVSRIQYKFIGLLIIVFVLLSSDTFINRILSRFDNAVNYKCPTSWGVCIQAIFLALIMIIIDMLIRQKII
jgi:hypothetical protein